MQTTLSPKRVNAVLEHVLETSRAEAPGVPRPVHVVYGGAHLFTAATHGKLGKIALAAMDAHAKDARAFGEIVGLADAARAEDLVTRVKKKLEREPVEAYCIDFEDGYGPRPDEEEDSDAVRAAGELAKMRDEERTLGESGEEGGRAPLVGIRVKSLGRRAARTLDLFVSSLAKARSGKLPPGFTVTLPKVKAQAEVAALVELLEMLEDALGVTRGAIGVELMIETRESLGALAALVAAAQGRCRAVHLGAYDLTASLGATASDQRMDSPLCDAARVAMKLALSGVAVVDGATTVLPVGKETAAVSNAWKAHASNVRRALAFGIWAGWDLHPAQLPARYGALYAYFLGERDAMAARLKGFVEKSKQATRSGQVFDDAATGRGLAAFFLRGLACGALFDDDLAGTGLTREQLAAL